MLQMCTPTTLDYVNPENPFDPNPSQEPEGNPDNNHGNPPDPAGEPDPGDPDDDPEPNNPPVPHLLTIILKATDSLKLLCSSQKVLEISKEILHQSPKKSRLETLTI